MSSSDESIEYGDRVKGPEKPTESDSDFDLKFDTSQFKIKPLK